MDELLTVAEYARRGKLDPDTVRRLARDGDLPAVRLGHQWRLPASSLIPEQPEETEEEEEEEEDTGPLDDLPRLLGRLGTADEVGWTVAAVLEPTLAADLAEWLTAMGIEPESAKSIAKQTAGELLAKIVDRFRKRAG